MNTLEYIQGCKGKGTSLVTLIMKSGSQPGDVGKRVTTELSAASNIKSRVNRQGVQKALRSIMSYATSVRSFGDNGVAIFAGQYV
jgi:peptide subunit release factor 1 (eRF1)